MSLETDDGVNAEATPDAPVTLPPVVDGGHAPREKQPSIWRVMRNRDYALLFWGQMISASGTQIQVVVVAWQVWVLTHSALALGAIGLVQAIPRLIFSLVGGVFADVYDRRRLLFVVNAILAGLSAVLALTTGMRVINIAIIYAIVLVAGAASSFEFPTRQAIIPTLVPRDQLASALSLGMVASQLVSIVGTALGGFVIAWLGIANSYWLDVISYVFVLAALVVMVVPRVPAEIRARAGVGALLDGMRFLREHPVILGVLSMDFCATFFGSPRSLLPIYATTILHVGSRGLGFLLAGTSIGALALAPLTGRISMVKRQGRGVALAIAGWGVCIIFFGFCSGPLWLSILFLAGAGAADMVSMLLRHLVIQLTTPDELRGRMSAVNGMFVIGGPMLGQFESGVVAAATSAQFSVVSGGVVCILATLCVVALVPSLLKVRVK